jgi:hypothetical protein
MDFKTDKTLIYLLIYFQFYRHMYSNTILVKLDNRILGNLYDYNDK